MIKPKNILLINDDKDYQQAFTKVIKDIDDSICVCSATNGVDALMKLNKVIVHPDILFMNINMSGMNCFEFLAQLKQRIRFKNIPIVILVTSNNPSDAQLAQKFGASILNTDFSESFLFKKNLENMLHFYFPPIIDSQESYKHIKIPLLPAGAEAHIISLLDSLS